MGAVKKFFALFGAQGDHLVSTANDALTAFDPETATKVDRQELEDNFRTIAIQLAQAQQKLTAEAADVENVNKEIARDLAAAQALIGQGKAEAATKLMDEIERLKGKLVHEEKERQAAQVIVDNFTSAHNKLKARLEEYDAKAKEAIDGLNEAKSEKAAAQAVRKSEELVATSAATTSGESSLAALGRLAAKTKAEASVDETMTNLGRSVAEKDSDVAAALAAVDKGAAANETPEQRLARLMGK